MGTKDSLGKIKNGEPKPPKIKKEKEKKVKPKESPSRKKPKLAESKSLDNSELSKEYKKERSDETIIKMKPVSKLKGKELNDRVKNQIRLMLSSDASSDESSVVKSFDKCGKPSKKDTKSSPTKKDTKLESKKQNGTSESNVKNDSECSAEKSTKPSSPK